MVHIRALRGLRTGSEVRVLLRPFFMKFRGLSPLAPICKERQKDDVHSEPEGVLDRFGGRVFFLPFTVKVRRMGEDN